MSSTFYQRVGISGSYLFWMGFLIEEGKRFLFAILKSEARVCNSFHMPLVMVWMHYRFGPLSIQSNLLCSLSFGENFPHAMRAGACSHWATPVYCSIGKTCARLAHQSTPFPGPQWWFITRGVIFSGAESWLLGPTNSLSVRAAQLER